MNRILLAALLLAVAACRLPPDRTPLRPLPEDNRIFTYDELMSRARAQAGVAIEAFYIDNWPELEQAAQGLEQTARLLPRTIDLPLKHKDALPKEAGVLHDEAIRLRDAARLKQVTTANEALQKINLKIRELRPDDEPKLDASKQVPDLKPK